MSVLICGSAHAQDKTPTVVIFGDSLSAGYGLARGTGWVDLLTQRLTQKGYPHRVVNASVSGETSAGGKTRIARVLAQHRPTVLVLELGANDGLRGQPIAQLNRQLKAIVDACTAHATKVLMVGMRIPPNYGAPYARAFEATFATLAKQHKLPLVPFLMAGFAERREMFQADGIHPAERAQGQMLDTVWKELEPMLRGEGSPRVH